MKKKKTFSNFLLPFRMRRLKFFRIFIYFFFFFALLFKFKFSNQFFLIPLIVAVATFQFSNNFFPPFPACSPLKGFAKRLIRLVSDIIWEVTANFARRFPSSSRMNFFFFFYLTQAQIKLFKLKYRREKRNWRH